jgi:hypothetical protein
MGEGPILPLRKQTNPITEALPMTISTHEAITQAARSIPTAGLLETMAHYLKQLDEPMSYEVAGHVREIMAASAAELAIRFPTVEAVAAELASLPNREG